MPDSHALLSPSSAERWINCTKAPWFEQEFPDNSGTAAEEGTAAHALAEHKIKKALKMRNPRLVSSYDSDEMEECTDSYRDYVIEQYEAEKTECPDAEIFVETRLDLSDYVPGSFGTSDCIIVSDRKLHVIDFKYGQGVLVDAEENPQMKMYALGALSLYESLYDFKTVEMTIFQPRRENVSTWEEPVNDLKEWAEEVLIPAASLASRGEGSFSCGPWCTFCRAAVRCRKRAEEKMALAKKEFALPPELTDSEIEEILKVLPDLTRWANDITAYATSEAVNHGKKWEGFKLVAGRSIRRYKDEDAVVQAAESSGYTDIYKKSLISLTEMEKLMGKKKFKEVLGDLIYKPPGKPTLVPETDRRKEITGNTAEEEFSQIKEANYGNEEH
ncbi:MAG: DUF2800 domain-containing protein [Candidatus Weimeria sp.]